MQNSPVPSHSHNLVVFLKPDAHGNILPPEGKEGPPWIVPAARRKGEAFTHVMVLTLFF
jgi:hypothetical protein